MKKPLFSRAYEAFLFINSYYRLNLFVYEAYRTVFFFPEPNNKSMYFVIDTIETLDDFQAFIIELDDGGVESSCTNLTKVIAYICSLATYKNIRTLVPKPSMT